jgi:diguanylate cyclase (GGDEF)-like protein
MPDFQEEEIFTSTRFYLDPDIFVPLTYKGEFLGLVTLGGVAAKGLSVEDTRLLQVLASCLSCMLIDGRFAREREAFRKEIGVLNRQLDDARETKNAFLQRLNKTFASLSLLDAEKFKALMVNLVFETVDVDRAVFFLRSEDEISLISVALAGTPGVVTKKIYFEIDNDFIEKLRLDKKPLFIETGRLKEVLESRKCNPETSAALVDAGLTLFVPFVSNERVLALLVLGPKRSGREFSPLELELLNTISFLFAAAIDNAKLFEAGVLDGLTKAYTRRFFESRLEYEMAVGMHYRTRRTLSLIMVDLDHFKQVNDTYGHQAGDRVLRQLAGIISNIIRMTDMVARYGGEEFVVILPELDLEDGRKIAEKIRAAVASTVFLADGPSLKITASFGVSAYPDYAKTKDELISLADKALYRSKESGRNQVTLCTA